VATAACARSRGIDTLIVGKPMALWRDHMPSGMFLRSGPDWHLDAADVHTFAAFLEERRTPWAAVDPVPIATFLEYGDWFIAQKSLAVRDDRVTRLTVTGGRFEAELASGALVIAERVVSATGIARFQCVPEWASTLPDGVAVHTCDLVDFESTRDRRLLIVGGRQSAYEWAALASDHGAARIDVVHRHPTPRFEKVSWRFVDPYIEHTMTERGWWRRLADERRQSIAREFWEVGRLTLEAWLTPRLPPDRVIRRPESFVSGVVAAHASGITVELSTGEQLETDRIVFATGYQPKLSNLAYLTPVAEGVAQRDGFPLLDEDFQSTVAGLYFTGFAATRDFGPFFGFTKGCPAAASILVDGLLRDF
jgi:cation diffusion facilitator CzcD-associated flavoprotein CzcO